MKLLNASKKTELWHSLCESIDSAESETQENTLLESLYEELYSTMDPKHVEIVCHENWRISKAIESGERYDETALTSACSLMVFMAWDAITYKVKKKIRRPVAMPPPVAEALLDPVQFPSVVRECRNCFYMVTIPRHRFDSGLFRDRCPVCDKPPKNDTD